MTVGDRVRITWIDQAKGIGIFLVVLGHTLRGLKDSRIIADGPAFRLADSWIYTFHMPLFFLLSGLFAERRINQGPSAFVRDKLATLAYPYLVWSTLQTLAQFASSGYANRKPDLSQIGWILVFPVMQFWFLYALFFISLIYYALRRAGLEPIGVLGVMAAAWASRGWWLWSAWWPLDEMRGRGIYYALGSVLNRLGWTDRLERAPTPAMILAAAAGFGVVTASALRPAEGSLLEGLGATLCGIAGSVSLAVLFGRAVVLGFVRAMGVDSLEIYVAHTIASAGIRIALQKILKVEDPATHIALGTVVGIVLPMILAEVARRLHADFLFRFPRRTSSR